MKTILTPVDLSHISSKVLQEAASLAQACQARLVLLHVIEPPMIASDYGVVLANMQEIMSVSERAATKQLERLRAKLKHSAVEVSVRQLTGSPVPLIVEQARKLRADYIVLGSHGHTAFYDLLVGGTTTGVLKRSPCPVVVVPPSLAKKKPSARK